MKNSFKNNLVKGIVVSSLVLGVGVTAILSPIAANAATKNGRGPAPGRGAR